MSKVNKFVYNLCTWGIGLILVINFRSVYSVIPLWDGKISMSSLLGLSIFSVILLIINGNSSLSKKNVYILMISFIYLVMYIFLQPGGRRDYINLALPLLIFIVLGIMVGSKFLVEILKKYSYLMVFIAVVSLVFWVFGSQLKLLPITGYKPIFWGTYHSVPSYFDVYFETQESSFSNLLSFSLIRNSAIFTEAPMASINFCIAFGTLLLLDKNKNIKKLVILALAVLSTMSVTGYIYLAGIVALNYAYVENSNSQISKLIKYSILPFIVVGIFVMSKKLVLQKTMGISGTLRLDDFRVLKETWYIHPWLGSGLGNTQILFRVMPYWRIRQNLTAIANSITTVWTNGGLYLMAVYIVPVIVGIVNSIKNKNYKKLIFIIGFVYLFVITISPYRYLTLLCLAMFLTNGDKVRNK